GNLVARLGRELDAALDLADLVGVLVDRSHVTGPELLAERPELLDQRIKDALALLHSLRANFRSRSAAEQALEDDLRIQLHRERTGPRHRFVLRCRELHPRDRVRVRAAVTFAAVA